MISFQKNPKFIVYVTQWHEQEDAVDQNRFLPSAWPYKEMISSFIWHYFYESLLNSGKPTV